MGDLTRFRIFTFAAAAVLAVGVAVLLPFSSHASPPPVVSAGGAQVVSQVFTVPANNDFQQQAVCPAGDVATGGGYQVPAADPSMVATQSYPSDFAVHSYGTTPQAWTVTVFNLTSTDTQATAYVVCYGTS